MSFPDCAHRSRCRRRRSRRFLEQHRLALHHRLGGEWTDGPRPRTAVPLVITPTRLPRIGSGRHSADRRLWRCRRRRLPVSRPSRSACVTSCLVATMDSCRASEIHDSRAPLAPISSMSAPCMTTRPSLARLTAVSISCAPCRCRGYVDDHLRHLGIWASASVTFFVHVFTHAAIASRRSRCRPGAYI